MRTYAIYLLVYVTPPQGRAHTIPFVRLRAPDHAEFGWWNELTWCMRVRKSGRRRRRRRLGDIWERRYFRGRLRTHNVPDIRPYSYVR